MRRKKNITLNLQNTTPHFTGKEKIITLGLIIIILNFTNIINTSALSYQSSAEVKFTFNPTLSINISPSNLIIDNLMPDTTADSNIINVSVATNSAHGYTLAATVGDNLHNNSNLTHTNSTNTFNSIAANSSLSNLTTDNTWGYSYKLSNNTTWSNYSGLSNETSKTLVNTDNQTAKPIDFKIAAKASAAQASGTYTNTINFIAISKPIPKTIEDIAYMQTFGELVETDLQSVKDSMTLNQDYALKDSRDEKEYYITKLADGHIWMTQNLDLDIDGARTYTHDDTDLGWTNPNTEATWTVGEGYSTIPWDATTGAFTGWSNQNALPYSADPGEKYYYTSNTTSNDTAFNSMAQCLEAGHSQAECKHYSAGNYYNWTAAIAGNAVSPGNNAPDSICPAGWRLPKVSANEFANLLVEYNVIPDISSTSYVTEDNVKIGLNNIRNYPLYFVRSGYIQANDGTLTIGPVLGHYWSCTANSSNRARRLRFTGSYIYPGYNNNYSERYYGASVRCLAR